MTLLNNSEISERVNSRKPDQIFVDPLLSNDQIGPLSLDLRLGYDFLVSVFNQNPSIRLHPKDNTSGPDAFFQSARRDLGDAFLIHPSQTVLATSLEYLGLPNDVYADVLGRSSYNRLGINVSSMFQPGFRGCVSLELFNHSNAPVELIVGSRVVQVRFFRIDSNGAPHADETPRKYFGNVRPTVSLAPMDEDLERLVSPSAQSR